MVREAGRDRESEVARNAALAAMAAATSCSPLPRPSDGGAPRWFGLRWLGSRCCWGKSGRNWPWAQGLGRLRCAGHYVEQMVGVNSEFSEFL